MAEKILRYLQGGVVSAARSFSHEDVLPLHRTSSRVRVIKCGHFLQALSSPTNQGLAESAYISTPTLLLLLSPDNFRKFCFIFSVKLTGI